jgi:hypothetical protein
MIMVLCTRTGRHIAAVSDVSRRHYEAMDALEQHTTDCWECGQTHVWSRRWVRFVEAEAEPDPTAPAGEETPP